MIDVRNRSDYQAIAWAAGMSTAAEPFLSDLTATSHVDGVVNKTARIPIVAVKRSDRTPERRNHF